MIKKFRCNWILIILIGFIISCDPSLSHKKIIHNNSDFDLKLIIENAGWDINYLMYDTLFFNADSTKMIINILIDSHSDKTILGYNSIGVVDDIEDCLIDCEIIDFDTSRFIVEKDISEMDNWIKNIEEEHNNGAGTVKCIYELNNTDIIIK